MVDFAGFLMPVSYEGVLAEHQAVRQNCGLFDISHMGEIFFEGPGAGEFVQYLTTNDANVLKDGDAQYSLLLDESGYALDDILVYRFSERRFMFCVNAANARKDLHWIKSKVPKGVELQDRSDEMGMVALQGPKSFQILKKLGFDLGSLERFQFRETQLDRIEVMLSRTGYTGEDGCEIFLANQDLPALWENLLAAGRPLGLVPVGLGARDTLRLEMGYALYGHELNETISPLEAGLGWVIKFQAGDFLGRDALLSLKAKGIPRQLVGVLMAEPGIPREGMEVFRGDRPIGGVRSGTMSPSLKKGIATALVEKAGIPADGDISVDIRGKMKKAKITKMPFIKKYGNA